MNLELGPGSSDYTFFHIRYAQAQEIPNKPQFHRQVHYVKTKQQEFGSTSSSYQ